MSQSTESRFDDLVSTLLDTPGVSPPSPGASAFGSNALKVDGRIFAMLVRGRLVVKLPARRVDDLVQHGEGERFDAGKSRPMREWLALDPSSTMDWLALAREALAFVGRT